MLLGDDEAPVGAPRRLVEEAEVLLGDLALVAAVGVHQPDIVAAAAVGGEGDAAAVGREARMNFPRQTLGDARRGAALDRHGVDVAQQGEGDAAAVGADVDIHPAAFVDVDRDLANARAERAIDVPLGRLGLGRGGGRDWRTSEQAASRSGWARARVGASGRSPCLRAPRSARPAGPAAARPGHSPARRRGGRGTKSGYDASGDPCTIRPRPTPPLRVRRVKKDGGGEKPSRPTEMHWPSGRPGLNQGRDQTAFGLTYW